MNCLISLGLVPIIAISISVLVLIICIVILIIFIKKRKGIKKHFELLKQDYEYKHALLTGQDLQYIQRLDVISRTNLLYGEIHSNFFKRFKEIRDVQDSAINDVINHLGALLENKNYHEYKEYYKENSLKIEKYKEAVEQLDSELNQIIKPEEECRQNILNLKNEFRRVKSSFNSKEEELSYVADSFRKVFQVVENQFLKFDDYLESADYDEANALLPKIEKTLVDLIEIIAKLPSLIEKTKKVIPEMLVKLEVRYNTLISKDFPLGYLNFDYLLEKIKNSLAVIDNKILNLSIENVEENLTSIENQINDLNQVFDNEELSKKEFDSQFETVTNKFYELEKDFIKVTNNIHKFKVYYFVDEAHEQALEDIKLDLDKVSKDKRTLENCLHSYEQTPYSILIQKTKALADGTEETSKKFEEFKKYQNSLKNDSESAFKNINDIYKKIKHYEAHLRSLYQDEITLRFQDEIEKTYDLMDKINNLAQTVPIVVSEINDLNNELNLVTNKLFSQLDEIFNYELKAKNNIILINRDRSKFSDVNTLLNQAENQYNAGDYKESFELTENILLKLKAKAGK